MPLNPSEWTRKHRPGFFGSRKNQKIKELNEAFGQGNWTLAWAVYYNSMFSSDIRYIDQGAFEFEEACKYVYEGSYFQYFNKHPEDLNFVCSFTEVIDNAPSNINSECDYKIQEARSTHIQDIAIRNVLRRMERSFAKPSPPLGLVEENQLVVRGHDSNGQRFNPGQIPLMEGIRIIQPSLAPQWAQQGSVEDFWQSNKYVFVRD